MINTETIIRNIDLEEMLDDTEIAYYMENRLNGLPFNNSNIDLDDIVVFVQSDPVSREISNIADKYISALSAGNFSYHITTGEVFDTLQNLSPELNDFFDHQMTESDHRQLVRILDDILDLRGMTISGLFEDFGIDTTLPYILFSHITLAGVIILLIINLLLICLYHKENIKSVLLFAGIPVAFSGFIFLVTGMIFESLQELMSGTLYTLARLADDIGYLIIRCGIVFCIAGLLPVAIYLFLRYKSITARTPPVSGQKYK